MDMAHITVIGRLTGDPVLKNLGQNKQVTEFRVAVNHRYRNDQGWKEKEASYFSVECWDRLAENTQLTLKRGMPVVVIGRLEQSTWYKDLGHGEQEKRSTYRINAHSVSPHLGERTAEVQFDRRRSKQLEEEMEKRKREQAGLGAPAEHKEQSSLAEQNHDDGGRELATAHAGFTPTGAEAVPPEVFGEQ